MSWPFFFLNTCPNFMKGLLVVVDLSIPMDKLHAD